MLGACMSVCRACNIASASFATSAGGSWALLATSTALSVSRSLVVMRALSSEGIRCEYEAVGKSASTCRRSVMARHAVVVVVGTIPRPGDAWHRGVSFCGWPFASRVPEQRSVEMTFPHKTPEVMAETTGKPFLLRSGEKQTRLGILDKTACVCPPDALAYNPA